RSFFGLQNHPLTRIVKDHFEPAKDFHPDMTGEAIADRRTFEEKIRQRLFDDLAAEAEPGHATELCLSVAAHAWTAAALRAARGFHQVIRCREIAAQAQSAVAPGVD